MAVALQEEIFRGLKLQKVTVVVLLLSIAVVASFSGFQDNKMKEDMVDRVLLLGGEVREGEVFDARITHVVTPPNCRTMKTLAASLTSRWLVTPNWIFDSTT